MEEGQVATYIPELGKAEPKNFGICLVTVDGKVFSTGDWQKEFTIQSSSALPHRAGQMLILQEFLESVAAAAYRGARERDTAR